MVVPALSPVLRAPGPGGGWRCRWVDRGPWSSLSPSRRPVPTPSVLGCPGLHAPLAPCVAPALTALPGFAPRTSQSSGQEVREGRLEEVAVLSLGEKRGPLVETGCPGAHSCPPGGPQVWSSLGSAALPGCPAPPHSAFSPPAHAVTAVPGRQRARGGASSSRPGVPGTRAWASSGRGIPGQP